VMRGRVTMLIADSRGSMPVTMACRNAEEGDWRAGCSNAATARSNHLASSRWDFRRA
jgi:hypothetical protein